MHYLEMSLKNNVGNKLQSSPPCPVHKYNHCTPLTCCPCTNRCWLQDDLCSPHIESGQSLPDGSPREAMGLSVCVGELCVCAVHVARMSLARSKNSVPGFESFRNSPCFFVKVLRTSPKWGIPNTVYLTCNLLKITTNRLVLLGNYEYSITSCSTSALAEGSISLLLLWCEPTCALILHCSTTCYGIPVIFSSAVPNWVSSVARIQLYMPLSSKTISEMDRRKPLA